MSFSNSIISVPQKIFFHHVNEVLQRIYKKQRAAWREEVKHLYKEMKSSD